VAPLEATPLVEALPVWVWFCGLLVTSVLGPAIVAWINNKKIRAEAQVTREDMAEIKGQVKNSHTSNLRVDLDEKFTELGDRMGELSVMLGGVRDDVGGLHSETRDLRQDVTGIRTDARRDRRQVGELTGRVEEHLAGVPQILEDALKRHSADCKGLPKPPAHTA
jgi:hypothetical protein